MRWIVRIFMVLLVVVVLAVGALFLIPAERIAALATDQISAATGRDVSVNGDVRPRVWPSLGVELQNIEIGNPDWVNEGPLIMAEALAIRVPWTTIFSGQVAVEELTLVSPRVTLVRAADGRVSWAIPTENTENTTGTAPDNAASTSGNATAFSLNQARLSDAAFVYIDHGTNQRIEVSNLNADITLPATGQAMLDAQATFAGTSLAIDVEIDGLNDLLAGGMRPIEARLDWGDGQGHFDGVVSLAPALDGVLNVSGRNLATLIGLTGQPAPAPLSGAAFGVDGRVALTTDQSVHLRDGQITFDDARITAEFDLLPGEARPLIRGVIQGDTLRLPETTTTASTENATAGGTAGGGSGGWSTDPIDVSGLFAVDADIDLNLGALDLGDTQIGPIDMRVTNTDGRAVFDIDRVGLFDGMMTGQFVANGRGGLSVRTDLNIAGVELVSMVSALAGSDRLHGTGNMSLQVLGVGNDMATLMRSLDGQGDLAIGAGEVRGFDLSNILQNPDSLGTERGGSTVFDSVMANFIITDGVLQNDDLQLAAPWREVTGAGQTDLGAQTLDYRLIPQLIYNDGSEDGSNLQVPVLFTGPWSDISIRPDLEYLARQELADQAARLEDEARARLAEEVESLEEQARDLLEE